MIEYLLGFRFGWNFLTSNYTDSYTYNAGLDLRITKNVGVGVYAKHWEWSDGYDNYLYGNMNSVGVKMIFTF